MNNPTRATCKSGLVALLLSIALPVCARAQTDVPSAFIGTWSGLAVQPDGQSFEARVRIEHGRVNENIGKVEYPDYDCGGDLYLIEERGWQIVVRERLTYGTDRCIDNGRILFSRPDENQAIMFEWSGSGVTATGVLEKLDR